MFRRKANDNKANQTQREFLPVCGGTIRRSLIPAGMLAGLFLFVLVSLSAGQAAADDGDKTVKAAHGQAVSLIVDYGNGMRKHFTGLPWRKGMTVQDAMEAAKSLRPGLTYTIRGSKDTAFLTDIDGIKNEGSAGKRNWLYWVNNAFGDRSIGIRTLTIDDAVVFRFGVWPG